MNMGKTFNGIMERILDTNIEVLTTYCNLTGCSIEFGNGGQEIVIIPPEAE